MTLARRGARGQARPAAVARLPDDLHDALLRHRAAGRHLVREARPEQHRHAPVRARLHPGDQPAVADPHRLRRLPRHREGVLRARRAAPGRTQGPGRRAAAARHPGRDGHARTAWSATGRPARCDARAGPDHAEARRGRTGLRRGRRRRWPRSDRCWTGSAPPRKARHGRRPARGRVPAPQVNGAVRGGVADGRPRLDRDIRTPARRSWRCPAPPTAGSPPPASSSWSGAPGSGWPTWPPSTRASRSRFADTQSRPVPVITSPEWSGSEHGGRRYSPFTINTERLKPWHTLTGRQHFFLDHDWMHELGEELPVFRPPLDMHKLFGEPRLGRNGELELTVRYLTPHSKWSIHSEYQDNLIMLTLSRGGPTMWMSEADAAKIGVTDNEWIEAVNRNGVVVCRAVVTPQDARGHGLHVPRPGAGDRRAEGGDERPARRHPQLADPAADQAHPPHRRVRAAVVRVQLPRPDRQPARRGHRDPPPLPGGASTDAGHGADVDGDEPRQVHRLPHLLGDLQAGVDQPVRRRVRLVQQRGVPPRPGLPAHLRGPGALAGRLGTDPLRPAQAARRRPGEEAAQHLRQPEAAVHAGLLRAVDVRLRAPAHRPGRRATPRWPGRSRCSPARTRRSPGRRTGTTRWPAATRSPPATRCWRRSPTR